MRLTVTATIADGWHVYSLDQGAGGPIPTRITLAEGSAFMISGSVRGPVPIRRFDPNFGIVVDTYERSATFTLPLKAAPSAVPGADTVGVRVRYEVCNASVCLPPRTVSLPVPITVTAH